MLNSKEGNVQDLDEVRNSSNLGVGNNLGESPQAKKTTELKVNQKVYKLFEEDMVKLLSEVKVSGILNKDKVYLTEDEVKESLRKFLYLYVRPKSGEGEEEYKLRYDIVFNAYFEELKLSKVIYKSNHESRGLVFDVRV